MQKLQEKYPDRIMYLSLEYQVSDIVVKSYHALNVNSKLKTILLIFQTMATKEYNYNDKISFLGEYFDYKASYEKHFVINFYPSDNSLDIFDKDLNRMFLKRTITEDVEMNDMFVGNTLRIYGRQIKLTDYADNHTRKLVSKTRECTTALVKPGVVDKFGEIINRIQDGGLQISKMRMCHLSRKEALEFYEKSKQGHDLPFVLEHIVSGPIFGMELVGENAIQRWLELMGPRDPIEARRLAPNSLRALYGNDGPATSGFHGASTPEEAKFERAFLFPEDDNKAPMSPVMLINATCCVIKPHAIREGNLGNIINAITNSHFKLTAAQMFYLSAVNADIFLDVYKGVAADYNALLRSYLEGPCVVLAIAAKNVDQLVYKEFREFCGPSDPEIARQIRPHTLRAIFGRDKYRNAVHCTDLEDDTKLEMEFFFKVLYT